MCADVNVQVQPEIVRQIKSLIYKVVPPFKSINSYVGTNNTTCSMTKWNLKNNCLYTFFIYKSTSSKGIDI